MMITSLRLGNIPGKLRKEEFIMVGIDLSANSPSLAALEQMAFWPKHSLKTPDEAIYCRNYIEDHGMGRTLELQESVQPVINKLNKSSICLDYEKWSIKGISPKVIQRQGVLERIQQSLRIGTYSVTDDDQIVKRAQMKGITVERKINWLVEHRHDNPLIDLLLKKRNLDMFIKRFQDGLPSPNIYGVSVLTGNWDSYSSLSGRISAHSLPMTALPKGMRDCYSAPDIDGEKAVYVSFDEAQVELRLLAGFSHCEGLIAQLLQGEDIHSSFASELFGVSVDSVTVDMRNASKKIIYGTIYGAGSQRLHKIVEKYQLPVEIQPNTLLQSKYPEMVDALRMFRTSDEIWYGLQQISIPPKIGNDCLSPAVKQNLPIQSAASLLIKEALVLLPDCINVVNVIHDELICWCKQSDLQWVSSQVLQAYERAATTLHFYLPMTNFIKVDILGGKRNE